MKRFALVIALAALDVAPAHAFKLKDLLNPKPNESAQTQSQSQPPAENKPADNKLDTQALAKTLFGKTSTKDEIRIGKQIAGNLLGATPLVRDDDLQRYVNAVGRWVAEQSGRTDINWYFGVLDTEDINAFAAPGGYVFLTRGLYRQLNNEAELAGVLGHEIAHVTLKHHMKLLKKSSIIGALGQAVGEQVKSNDQIVQNLIGNGAEIMARGLDKDAELEADRVGAVFAARAGYEPWGLPTVLQDLTALPSGDKRTSLLYKTHPAPAERLAALGDAIGSRFDGLTGKELADRFYRLK
jgi:beta-barrel assembly-enhancing protease